MDFTQRRKICELVAGVLVADEVMLDEEKAFLDRVYARFKLPADLREHLRPISDVGAASASLREMPEDVRRKVMGLLIEAAVVDGVVHPAERTFMLIAAAALGVDADVVESRVSKRLAELPTQGPSSNP